MVSALLVLDVDPEPVAPTPALSPCGRSIRQLVCTRDVRFAMTACPSRLFQLKRELVELELAGLVRICAVDTDVSIRGWVVRVTASPSARGMLRSGDGSVRPGPARFTSAEDACKPDAGRDDASALSIIEEVPMTSWNCRLTV